MENINRFLYDKRLEKGLSRQEAAHQMGLSHLRLYLYEEGYWQVNETSKRILEEFYGLPLGTLTSELGYPSEIFAPTKEPKILNWFFKVFSNKLALAIEGVILLTLVALIPTGFHFIDLSNSDIPSFYSEDYSEMMDFTRENGALGFNPFNPMETIYTYTYSDGANKAKLVAPEADTYFGDGTYTITQIEDSNTITYDYYPSTKRFMMVTIKKKDAEGHSIYAGMVQREGLNTISIIAMKYGYGEDTVDLHSGDILWDVVSTDIQSNLASNDAVFNGFSHSNLKGSPTLYETLMSQVEGNIARNNLYETGLRMVIYSSLGGAIALFTLIFSLILILTGKRKEKPLVGEPIKEVVVQENKPLPRNWRLTPFVPETFLRFSGIPILLVSSLALFAMFGSLMQILPIAFTDTLTYHKIAGNLLAIATILLFYLKLDILTNNKKIVYQLLGFFGGGVLFYIFEVMVIYDLAASGNFYVDLVLSYFPGNLLWGVGTFSLLTYFLFTTPNWAKTKRWKLILWRSLSLLPATYLIMSNIYSFAVSNWGWARLDYPFACLLCSKSFIVSCFAILYIYGCYFLKLFSIFRYGDKNAATFRLSNQYIFLKNIWAVLLLLGLGLLDLYGSQADWGSSLSLGKSYYIMVLAPFALFYHPHFGQRNMVLDLSYVTAYGLSYSISYLLIAIYFLAMI